MYRGSASPGKFTQTDRSATTAYSFFICLIGIGTLQPVVVVFAAERCPAANATKVVSVQGNVTWNVINNATLTPAKLNDTLCVGDTVRVGAKSRAVLRLSNETTIPLDQNTIFQLKQAISEKEPTLIDLLQGAIHVITRTPKPFKVDTPYLNALVEGTEFYVGVDNQEARVAVIEGKVNVSNEQGAVLLTDNEAASARKGQAPQKTLTIKPRDAVQWALYYPPLFDPRSRSGSQSLANAHELYSQGKITEAIESLEAIPETERNGDFYSYKAGLLLLVGRADEAEPDIETALRENQNNTDALSLKAIIAIAKNDKAKALELANQAVNIDDKSAQARIALSYALQADFKIEEALKQARQATERDPNNALAWARVAELELSIPNYDKSKEAAEKSATLNPYLSRTQSVLGFAKLTRIDIKAAKNNFNRAIELDQLDPLPRLGLGLATIREGKLEQGREQIEIAASLDPENSLIRSYLGKAYYEEKRDDKAATQFELAKERDPKDPTPYLYDAAVKQSEARPIAAIQDLEKAMELNGNRGVFRSKALLDSDIAGRVTNLANTYNELRFSQLAIRSATQFLADDPGNDSLHRSLSQAYSNLPSHDIARVSEWLQGQLRQPINTALFDPQLATNNLFIAQDTAISRYGLNEYQPAFVRNQVGFQFDGVVGSRGTLGQQLIATALSKQFTTGFSQFHHETNGFRDGDDVSKDIYSLFAQYQFSPMTSYQFEAKRSSLNAGKVLFAFDPDLFFPDRISEKNDTVRIGARHSLTPSSDLIISVQHQRNLSTSEFESFGFTSRSLLKAWTAETQYLLQRENYYCLIGAGVYEGRSESEFVTQRQESANAYVYSQIKLLPSTVRLHLGLAGENMVLDNPIAGHITRNRISPKIGLIWNPWPTGSLRAASFYSLKRFLISSQTIEPTNVAGFTQFFSSFDQFAGDPEGTISRQSALAFDQRIGAGNFLGIELTHRKSNIATLPIENFDQRRTKAHLYFYRIWDNFVHSGSQTSWEFATTVAYQEERQKNPIDFTLPNGVVNLRTRSIPIGLNFYHKNRCSYRLTVSRVTQTGTLSAGSAFSQFGLDDSGWFTDAEFSYFLPKRLGVLSFGGKNLFDKTIKIQEVDPVNPRSPGRRFLFAKLRINL